MDRKIRIAVLYLPFGLTCPSVESASLVDRYLSKKYNIEHTYFVDPYYSKINLKYLLKGEKKLFVKGLDTSIRLFRPLTVFLNVLGLPHFYYPSLKKHLAGYDVIIASNPERYIFGLQALFWAKKNNVKLVLYNSASRYCFWFKFTKRLIVPLIRKIVQSTHFFLFTNSESKLRYEEFGFIENGQKNVLVTGLALNTDVFKPMKIKKYSKFTIVTVGGLYPVKGHQIVIMALAHIIKLGITDVELHIYGTGDYRSKLEKLAKDLTIYDFVKFKGHVSHEKLAKAYNKSHVLAIANLKEFTPPIGEAMLCNIPVVVMECGGIKFIVPDESYGIITKRLDSKAMAEKIMLLKQNKKMRDNLSKKGRKYISDIFGYRNVAEKVVKGYI